MCWQCAQIDKEIEHYQGLGARAGDQGSVKCIGILIEKLEGEKNALHILELKFSAKTPPQR